MNALLDQKKTEYWWLDFDGVDKIRLQATVAEILDEDRPTKVGKGDQLIHGALEIVLIKAILNGRLRYVHATVGKILGLNATDVKSLHNGEVEPKKPLAKAAGK